VGDAGEPDLERERAALLEAHARERRAHFETDAQLLFADLAGEWTYVRGGAIERIDRGEAIRRFGALLDGAVYHEWDDLEPPIIRIAGDASLAWMITRVQVRYTRPGGDPAEREVRFVYAGIDTYEKRDGRWVRVANVSTFAG
jgi:hypothetical protein